MLSKFHKNALHCQAFLPKQKSEANLNIKKPNNTEQNCFNKYSI